MATNDDEILVTCLTPEIHKLNEKLTKEHRSQATEAEFLGAFEIAMRNMINQARADTAKQIFKELDDIRVSVSPVTIGLDLREDIKLRKKFNIEE